MLTNQLRQLAEARATVAELEKVIAVERNTELAGLPARYGFENADAFIAAVRSASGKRRGRKPGRRMSAGASVPGRGKRRRAVITDDTRAEVKRMTQAGKSGSDIAKALKISLPSVHNIRKALGLVKAPKK